MTQPTYLLDNGAAQAEQRFESLATVFNRWTFQHLDDLGVGAGWHCWEVGAGGPSVPAWLAQRVGASGSVVATDIDPSWMKGDPAYRTIVHDVAKDEPPGSFDLVHLRLVLTHVPERDEALRRMVGALRPGGWLVVEDFDVALQPSACLDPTGGEEQRANRVRAAFVDLLTRRGVDLQLGRTLPARLRQLGLVDVAADAYLPLSVPATRALERANVFQVRDGLVASGVDEVDVDGHLATLTAGTIDVATPPLVTASGRRR